MSLISIPNIFTVGAVIVASQHNSNFSTIYNDYNGNIDHTNLSASAAIADSQLAQISTAGKISGAALTLLPSIPSGAGLIPLVNIPSSPYVKVSERQTQTTNSISPTTTGSWQTAVLNTTDNDTTSISSLGSNQVTLPLGTYKVKASFPFAQTGKTQMRIQNITAGTTLISGQSIFFLNASSIAGLAQVSGLITLSVSSAIAVQYQIQNSVVVGQASGFGVEVYTVAEFTKVA